MGALKQPVISQTLLPLTLQVRTAYLTVKIVVRWLRGCEKALCFEQFPAPFLNLKNLFSADLSDEGLNRSF